MATDATGTPTSKGIPKYNPDADAPSGLGFNAAMDAIDGLLDKAQYSTDTKGTNKVPVWNGSAWVYSLVTTGMLTDASVTGGKLALNSGSTPPASPNDGDLWLYTGIGSGINWLLRYNAGSASTYKWEWLGGSAADSYVATAESTLSTTYTDLATVGPQVTVPRAGEYKVEFGAVCQPNASASIAAATLFVNAVQQAEGVVGFTTAGGNSEWSASTRTATKTFAVSDVVKLKYITGSGAINGTFTQRWLKVTPIRVS